MMGESKRHIISSKEVSINTKLKIQCRRNAILILAEKLRWRETLRKFLGKVESIPLTLGLICCK